MNALVDELVSSGLKTFVDLKRGMLHGVDQRENTGDTAGPLEYRQGLDLVGS